ncbi:tail fiber domain-containing protein [Alterinioella nitratireducens]|uniref:tail fiber domain-containing protein n=1 Tax=Alterinioella nitratireducens TaxID=2735915 RepID=UPI0040582E2C
MLKTVLAATTALSFAGATSLAAQTAPATSVEIVTQDTTSTAPDERHLLVPILFVVLVMGAASGGGSGYGGAVASDERLKTDIARIGTAPNGLPVYQFSYIGMAGTYQGVMAQDVLSYRPEAVIRHPSGYLMVNYDMLGLEMTRVE